MLSNPEQLTCVICTQLLGDKQSLHIIVSGEYPKSSAVLHYRGASAHVACVEQGDMSKQLKAIVDMKAMTILNQLIEKE